MINQSMEARQSETANFVDTMDGLNAGVLLVDAQGRIVHTNTAAQAMLSADDFLRSIGGQMIARDVKANQACAKFSAASAGLIAANGGASL